MSFSVVFQNERSNDKAVHFHGCPYLSPDRAKLKCIWGNLEDLYSSDYHFCSHCSPVSFLYHAEQQVIEQYANTHSQELSLQNGTLYISNGYSSWMVLPANETTGICLYHKSTANHGTDLSKVKGYHMQNKSFSTILEILEYIVKHDIFRKKENRKNPEYIYACMKLYSDD